MPVEPAAVLKCVLRLVPPEQAADVTTTSLLADTFDSLLFVDLVYLLEDQLHVKFQQADLNEHHWQSVVTVTALVNRILTGRA